MVSIDAYQLSAFCLCLFPSVIAREMENLPPSGKLKAKAAFVRAPSLWLQKGSARD